jgi:acetyl-CoA carboxylase biotin carboxyl carrier protein
MSELEPESDSEVFDVERIRKLVAMMDDHELTEIDLRHSNKRIRLRKGGQPEITVAPVQVPQVAVSQATVPGAPGAAANQVPAAEEDGPNIAYVKSPMVGTFYSRPKPDAPTFVKVGEHVDEETQICIIEAMKVFNEIPAEVSGKVVAVMVSDEEHVDFDKILFKIDTTG